jgi:hypothetical protein
MSLPKRKPMSSITSSDSQIWTGLSRQVLQKVQRWWERSWVIGKV